MTHRIDRTYTRGHYLFYYSTNSVSFKIKHFIFSAFIMLTYACDENDKLLIIII